MLRDRAYQSVVSSHFTVDLFNGLCGILPAMLSVPLGLSNTQVGTAITFHILMSALSQPFFGWLGDYLGKRHGGVHVVPLLLMGGSVVWMAVFLGLLALTPTWWFLLIAYTCIGLGSGLFHPIATALAAALQEKSANTATAVFFLCGQMGLALGPLMGGILYDAVGMTGILPLTAIALFPAVLTWSAVQRNQLLPRPPRMAAVAGSGWLPNISHLLTFAVLAFILVVGIRSSMQGVGQFLVPKLLEDRGWEASVYGPLAGLFMATAAVGNVIIGQLADRFGMRIVTFLTLLLSVPAGLVLLTTSSVPLAFVAGGLTGFLVGGQHSILVVYGQNLLPTSKSLASGLILGFVFGSGAAGTWISGVLADTYGLQQVLQGVILLGVPAAFLSLTLPGRDTSAPLDVPVVATQESPIKG